MRHTCRCAPDACMRRTTAAPYRYTKCPLQLLHSRMRTALCAAAADAHATSCPVQSL